MTKEAMAKGIGGGEGALDAQADGPIELWPRTAVARSPNGAGTGIAEANEVVGARLGAPDASSSAPLGDRLGALAASASPVPTVPPSRLGSFSPRSLLVSLCAYGFSVYGDRGVIASNGVNGQRSEAGEPGWGIVGRFSLSATQDGFIPAALVVGIMASVVASAMLSRRLPSTRLLSFGAASLTAGWAVCASAPAFWALLAGRLLVGAGAGPFVALATPLIEDVAPAASTTAWIASVFVSMTTGYAAGFVYGGLLSDVAGWRAIFAGQTVVGAALALWLALHAPVTLRVVGSKERGGERMAQTHGEEPSGPGHELAPAHEPTPAQAHDHEGRVSPPQPSPPSLASPPSAPPPFSASGHLLRDLARLASCRDLVVVALSLSIYVGALGAFAFYGPEAGRSVLGLTPSGADALFGGVSLFTGVAGTLGGGVLLDLLGARPRSATTLCAAGCFLAALGAYAAFSPPGFGLVGEAVGQAGGAGAGRWNAWVHALPDRETQRDAPRWLSKHARGAAFEPDGESGAQGEPFALPAQLETQHARSGNDGVFTVSAALAAAKPSAAAAEWLAAATSPGSFRLSSLETALGPSPGGSDADRISALSASNGALRIEYNARPMRTANATRSCPLARPPFATSFFPSLASSSPPPPSPPPPAPARSPVAFTLLLVPGLLALFSVGAPSQRALLWASPPHLRPLALAAAEISQHVFGDLPLPPLLGAAQDRWNSWPLTMGLAALASAVAGAGFVLAGRWAGQERNEPGRWIERGGEPLARQVAEIDGEELERGLIEHGERDDP